MKVMASPLAVHCPAPSPARKRKAAPAIAADDDGWNMTYEEECALAHRTADEVDKEGILSQAKSDKVTARLKRLLGDAD